MQSQILMADLITFPDTGFTPSQMTELYFNDPVFIPATVFVIACILIGIIILRRLNNDA
jgi:hypothetical protein